MEGQTCMPVKGRMGPYLLFALLLQTWEDVLDLQQIVRVAINCSIKKIGRILILPIFSVLFYTSCNKSKFDLSTSNEGRFYLKDSLLLKLDSKSSYDFSYFDLGVIEEKEKLIILNRINSSVDFYNLNCGELESRFIIQQDGPSQLRDAQGLLFHNKDIKVSDVIPVKENMLLAIGTDGFYQYDCSDVKNIVLLSKILVEK